MSKPTNSPGGRTASAVRRLLRAIDNALAAAQQVAQARAALDREARRTGHLRIVPRTNEEHDAR